MDQGLHSKRERAHSEWSGGGTEQAACAIGHLKTLARPAPEIAGVGVLLLPGDGVVRVEADGVVLLVVGAGDCDVLGVNLGVEPDKLVLVALYHLQVGGVSNR